MDLIKAIAGRRAVRAKNTTAAVDEVAIRQLIGAAVRAPSAVNRRPWTFTVVRNQALFDRISHNAKAHVLTTLSPGLDPDHFRTGGKVPRSISSTTRPCWS